VRERDGACIDWGVRAKAKAKTAQHKRQQQWAKGLCWATSARSFALFQGVQW